MIHHSHPVTGCFSIRTKPAHSILQQKGHIIIIATIIVTIPKRLNCTLSKIYSQNVPSPFFQRPSILSFAIPQDPGHHLHKSQFKHSPSTPHPPSSFHAAPPPRKYRFFPNKKEPRQNRTKRRRRRVLRGAMMILLIVPGIGICLSLANLRPTGY